MYSSCCGSLLCTSRFGPPDIPQWSSTIAVMVTVSSLKSNLFRRIAPRLVALSSGLIGFYPVDSINLTRFPLCIFLFVCLLVRISIVEWTERMDGSETHLHKDGDRLYWTNLKTDEWRCWRTDAAEKDVSQRHESLARIEELIDQLDTRDVDVRDQRGETALTCVKVLLRRGHFGLACQTAGLLLGRGADVDAEDCSHQTLLSHSVAYLDQTVELTRLLLNHGAQVWHGTDYSNSRTGSPPFFLDQVLSEPRNWSYFCLYTDLDFFIQGNADLRLP